jgi:hypothetical protein
MEVKEDGCLPMVVVMKTLVTTKDQRLTSPTSQNPHWVPIIGVRGLGGVAGYGVVEERVGFGDGRW